jgi:hypothetical protein
MLHTVLAISSLIVPASLFPANTAFDITMEVLHRYRSRCVYLLHSPQEFGK